MIRRGMVGFPLALLALAALVLFRVEIGLPLFYVTLLSTLFFWTAQATSWNILSGYSGYFSFGQGAFVGVGVYTTAVLTGRHGWTFFQTLPVAAVLSTLLALGIGGIAFRLRSFRGETFALLTLAVPFILAALARITPAIDGGQGLVVPVPDLPGGLRFQEFLYLVTLVIAVAAVATAFAIQHSRFGQALAAVRDAEDVAEGLGVATFRWKMLAIATSGLIGGVAGSTYALQIGFVSVEAVFILSIPLFVIVISVLGGRTHWLGPVVGAAVIVLMWDRLAASGFERWRLIILGGLLAVLVIAAPDGLVSRLRARVWPVLGAALGAFAALALLRVWGQPLDWVAAGMLVAAAVAFWPPRRPRAGPVVADGAVGVGAGGAADGAVGVGAGGAAGVGAGGAVGVGAGGAADGAVPAGTAAAGEEPAGGVLIECQDLTRHFGGVRALDGLDLHIRQGELVGLVGPNGSGKTTLVNLLSGAIRPTRGRIAVAGREVSGLAPHLITHAGVTRTYQIPRPFESMTVRDNVAMAIMFGRQSRSLAESRAMAGEHLDFVGLGHLASALPSQINLHQRQLLEMARALATSPKALLLDEALAGLNPAEIDNAVQVVRRIHAAGVTIVIVEHLLRVVNQLATRVVVLDRGRCLADGDPDTVMRDPAVVHAYLGKSRHA